MRYIWEFMHGNHGFNVTSFYSVMYDQIWDPKRAVQSGNLNYVQDKVPHNKREVGFVLLHELNYNVNQFMDKLDRVSRPSDCSTWTLQEKDMFRRYIYQYRKDLSKVAKMMNKSLNSCYCYFLSNYKKTNDYVVLKFIRKQNKAEVEDDCCAICQDGGDLIICETCDASFHLHCLTPPLLKVPDCDWYCDECMSGKLHQVRKLLLDGTTFRRAWEHDESCIRASTQIDDQTKDRASGTTFMSASNPFLSSAVLSSKDCANPYGSLEAPSISPQAALKKFVNAFAAIMKTNSTTHRANKE